MPFGVTIVRRCVSVQAWPMFLEDQASDCDSWWHYDCWRKTKPQQLWSSSDNFTWNSKICNVKFNYERLQYKKEEADFFGETYTTSGHMPDQTKVSAITKMSVPTSKKQVLSFIGMINYLPKLSTRLSEIEEPIRWLSTDKVPLNWGPEHQSTFTQIKKEVASAHILAYYNPKKQRVFQTDASIKGLGACLLKMRNQYILLVNSLTDAQKGYVAIELECACNCLGNGKNSSFLMCKPYHSYNWPKASWSNFVNRYQPGNIRIEKNFH